MDFVILNISWTNISWYTSTFGVRTFWKITNSYQRYKMLLDISHPDETGNRGCTQSVNIGAKLLSLYPSTSCTCVCLHSDNCVESQFEDILVQKDGI